MIRGSLLYNYRAIINSIHLHGYSTFSYMSDDIIMCFTEFLTCVTGSCLGSGVSGSCQVSFASFNLEHFHRLLPPFILKNVSVFLCVCVDGGWIVGC